jgi:hypothetical protein
MSSQPFALNAGRGQRLQRNFLDHLMLDFSADAGATIERPRLGVRCCAAARR